MRVINTISALLALAPFASLGLTVPPLTGRFPSTLAPRGSKQYCYNGPNTVAGTTFTDRPDVEPEAPTSQTLIWCTPNTQTYISLLYARPLSVAHAWNTIEHVVDEAWASTNQEITTGGDRVIATGEWSYEDGGVEVYFENTNNHQQTWGVVGAALIALEQYFQMTQAAGAQPGAIIFDVFDGANQVGNGTFGEA